MQANKQKKADKSGKLLSRVPEHKLYWLQVSSLAVVFLST